MFVFVDTFLEKNQPKPWLLNVKEDIAMTAYIHAMNWILCKKTSLGKTPSNWVTIMKYECQDTFNTCTNE